MSRITCGARKPDGTACRLAPVYGGERCRFHGGLTPSGIGHPNYKHGMYSRSLPPGLRSRFEEALNDPELLSAVEEVGLLRVRIAELLKRLEAGGGREAWAAALEIFGALENAFAANDRPALESNVVMLGGILRRGADAEEAWHDLYDAIERKTLVAAREWKRQVDLQQVITADRAMALIAAIMQSVARHVPDVEARRLISHDIRGIVNVPLPEPVRDVLVTPAACAADLDAQDQAGSMPEDGPEHTPTPASSASTGAALPPAPPPGTSAAAAPPAHSPEAHSAADRYSGAGPEAADPGPPA